MDFFVLFIIFFFKKHQKPNESELILRLLLNELVKVREAVLN